MSSSDFEKLSLAESRIAALKSVEQLKIEQEIDFKTFELQAQYRDRLLALDEKKKIIITGKEITAADCENYLNLLPNSRDVKEFVGQPPKGAKSEGGIKDFWLTALLNYHETTQMITEEDKPLLLHLTNIVSIQISPDHPHPDYPNINNGHGLILEFHFSPNEYFTNDKLFKQYSLGFSYDEDRPLHYDGLVPLKITNSIINWNPGKNLTIKTVRKTQKNKRTKEIRIVNKTQKVESFFNFFSRIEVVNGEDRQSIIETLLMSDYDLACEIQTEVIARSIIYYMNENPDFSEDEDDNEDDEDDNDEDEETSDESSEELVRRNHDSSGSINNNHHGF